MFSKGKVHQYIAQWESVEDKIHMLAPRECALHSAQGMESKDYIIEQGIYKGMTPLSIMNEQCTVKVGLVK